MMLREKISVYRKQQTRADDGTLQTVRKKIASAFANVRPGSGGETNRGDQNTAVAKYTFTILDRSDLQPDDIIVWHGRGQDVDYNIRFIGLSSYNPLYMQLQADRGETV